MSIIVTHLSARHNFFLYFSFVFFPFETGCEILIFFINLTSTEQSTFGISVKIEFGMKHALTLKALDLII